MITSRTLLTVAIGLAVAACTDGPVAVATDLEPQFVNQGQGVLHVASGSGHRVVEGGNRRIFSFGAQEYEDGAATGQFQLSAFPAQGPAVRFWHGEVTCVSVDDNKAWVGGVITRSHDPVRVGQGAFFRVVDQGERNSDLGADQISSLRFGPTPQDALDACENKIEFGVFGILQGNIQVAPGG